MSRVLFRLLLTTTLTPATVVVFTLIYLFFAWAMGWTQEQALLLADVVTGLLLAVVWIWIWYRMVRWTPTRYAGVAVVFVGAAIVAALVHQFVVAIHPYFTEVGLVLAGLCWVMLWTAGTGFVWRESRAERAERLANLGGPNLACPNCGYNLTGLHQARCPECGTEYTLDGLFAANADQAPGLESE